MRDNRGFLLSHPSPLSCRNRVLYFFRRQLKVEILKNLIPSPSSTVTKSKNENEVLPTSSRTKKSRTEPPSNPRNASQRDFVCPEMDLPLYTTAEENEATPFTKFTHYLLSSSGTLKWRIHGLEMDVIAMNDIDLNSGLFQKNRFIHMYRRRSSISGQLSYWCNCKMYGAVQQMETQSSLQTNYCCHIRFFIQHVEFSVKPCLLTSLAFHRHELASKFYSQQKLSIIPSYV